MMGNVIKFKPCDTLKMRTNKDGQMVIEQGNNKIIINGNEIPWLANEVMQFVDPVEMSMILSSLILVVGSTLYRKELSLDDLESDVDNYYNQYLSFISTGIL